MKKMVCFLLFVLACVPQELTQLASEHGGSIAFYKQAQDNLKVIYSQCNYEIECFNREGLSHIQKDFCPNYALYKFVSKTECLRGGPAVISSISGQPFFIRNTGQDASNDRGEILNTIEQRETEKRKKDDLIRSAGKISELDRQRLDAERSL